ncbi:hypothetical protein DMH12_24865 [Streptomyces sp. WAC 04229]|uniref:hypothetical protein n=1 Tax=Streptomyces sp. WAC 04229 TaxID=2203206 RepID=UPI000F73B85A|nr:hypothetical protein [Streptomyces sp. WAC 04229]RSN50517.1 hypothetical protein DMH12_24865 [Streptomyces sp. WAC 04229]
MDEPQKVGRCQHCQQTRPVFPYTATFDNGEPIWSTPCPPYWADLTIWLCARDWSNAETARVNGRTFHIEHGLVVFAEDQPRTRIWAGGRELLTRAEEDLNTCKAILAVTEA